MAFKYQGKEISTWIYRGKEISSIIQDRQEIHSAANLITADGFVLVSLDGFTLNSTEIK